MIVITIGLDSLYMFLVVTFEIIFCMCLASWKIARLETDCGRLQHWATHYVRHTSDLRTSTFGWEHQGAENQRGTNDDPMLADNAIRIPSRSPPKVW